MLKRKIMTIVTTMTLALLGWGETVLPAASSTSVPVDTTFVDGSSISSSMKIDYGPFWWDTECSVTLNGIALLSSTNRSTFTWQPRQLGENVLVWSSAGVTMTSTVNVERLTFYVQPEPNPPMPVDANITITPETRTIEQGGGGGSIITSGSGTWTAAASEPWIKLNATSGQAGYPVAYQVTASTNVGERVGYVYVSGHVHTVKQSGYLATVSPTSVEYEHQGGTGEVEIGVSGRFAWDARPNVDWLSVSPTHGVGSGKVTYQVAPYNEVATRSGTLTVGDKTVTVFQYGRRMKLSSYSTSCDYYAHVIPLTVNALAVTEWTATPNASWISVVDSDNGRNRRGGSSLSLAVGENLSYLPRTGTVTIGTETFTITQEMIDEQNGTVAFVGDYFAIADDRGESDDEWADSKMFLHDYSDNDGIWQEFFVEVDGKKEPAQFGDKNSHGFAIPVVLSGGATLSAQDVKVVVDSGVSGYIRTVEVKTDHEMSAWEDFPYGKVDASRVWIVIRQKAISTGVQYECDLTDKLAANGRKMREWAAENGETFPQSVRLPVSASYVVRIKERDIEFPVRFWNVYNPMLDRLDAFDGDDYEEEDYIEYPGLWLVTQEMIDEQQGVVTPVVSPIAYVNLHGATHTNPATYQEGTVVNFTPPSGRTGYIFTGWTPAAITADMTGAQTVTAVWEKLEPPVVTPADGSVFMTDTCEVSIGCATEGATIYYSTTAVPRIADRYVYSAPFTISDTTKVYAFSRKDGQQSETVQVTITKHIPTLAEALDLDGLEVVSDQTIGWVPELDESALGGLSARSGRIDPEEESAMELSINGAGTLTFKWRVDCEDDGPGTATWDYLVYFADSKEGGRIDGLTEWKQRIVTFTTPGDHTVKWAYHKDDYDEPDFAGEDCGWVDDVVWTPYEDTTMPSITDDPEAQVIGDSESGFVVKPSEGKVVVEVTIPQGVDAAKVTVEVTVKVQGVKLNGAKVKIVSVGGDDITSFLDLPVADGNGVIDLTKATVKEEIVKETLDPEKGAKIELDAANPKLTTPNTRAGLFYQLREGETLGGMKDGDSTIGNGEPWTPDITVKGGDSAFFSIDVSRDAK